jgi:parallel beta-helix repeat protein
VYRDSIRVTKNISICGVGKLGSVIIEAPGWNDALYFAGLGMDGEYVNPKTSDTGELADISNLVFRAPNPEQGFIAHIVRGTPRIHHCDIQGGLWISGCKPKITHNTIRWSRSCGVKITDRACPEIKSNVILNNKFGGIKVKRSNPLLTRNIISENQSYGMVITTDSAPTLFDNEIKDELDQPKFNPLEGVYGPLEAPQECGFCGSRWARRNSLATLLARGALKITSRTGSGFVEQKNASKVTISPAIQPAAVGRTSEVSLSDKRHAEIREASEVPFANPSAPCFRNHCCWVEPGEISSDDDQLYGDDDIGNL